MPSTNKTPYINLNSFIGEDKPKMNDFNYDNQQIDNAMQNHCENEIVHISTQDRTNWNSSTMIMGTYVGDGFPARDIDIGFQPSCCFLFHKDYVPFDYDDIAGSYVHFAIATHHGCTKYISINPTGFNIQNNNSSSPMGTTPKLNIQNHSYVYIAYK